MENKHREQIKKRFGKQILLPIKILNIEDNYNYMDPELIELLRRKIEKLLVY